MQLLLFNTLTRKKEPFYPLDSQLVKMYVCGPTVYDYQHIGNARSAIVYDILYRMLLKLYGINNVLYVKNITDIDDKIINRAFELNIPISVLTKKNITSYNYDMQYLGCLKPTKQPRVTNYIPQIIEAIQKLLDLGFAYESNKHIYFNVSKIKNYTTLSGRSIEEMKENGRIENDKNKNNPEDFVLWKPANDKDPSSIKFISPFGIGRPGWHIECSVMSNIFLGSNFDIHGGGIDLIFPHHSNEIAQSCSIFPGSKYAKYWIHNGFLTVNKQKMSKSIGNVITIKNCRKNRIKGDIIRLSLINTHYHKPLDYNDKLFANSEKILNYWYRIIEELSININNFDEEIELPQTFLNSLLDNLNTPMAIKIINDFAKEFYKTTNYKTKMLIAKKMMHCAQFLGFFDLNTKNRFNNSVNYNFITQLIEKRTKAKIEKNWELADYIRSSLHKLGISIEDKIDGTTSWKKIPRKMEIKNNT